MGRIKPDGSGATPPFWRNVWNAYSKLLATARKGGADVSQWYLDAPGKGVKMFRGWELQYTPPGNNNKLMTIGIGRDANEAIVAINRFQALWDQWNREPKAKPTKRKSVRPIDKPSYIVKYADLLDAQLRNPNIKINKWYWDNIGKHKAGYLEVNMETYLRTEIGRLFPIPPKDRQQWDEYKRQYDYVKKSQYDSQHPKEESNLPTVSVSTEGPAANGWELIPLPKKRQ